MTLLHFLVPDGGGYGRRYGRGKLLLLVQSFLCKCIYVTKADANHCYLPCMILLGFKHTQEDTEATITAEVATVVMDAA